MVDKKIASGESEYKIRYQIRNGVEVLRSDYEMVGDCQIGIDLNHVGHLNNKLDKQVKFDISFLNIARLWSQNSHAKRRKTGCLIVKNYSIISDGYNGTPIGMDNNCEDENGETKWHVLHAETNAISKLAKSNQSSDGATLYTTFSPCKNCAKLILQSGIVRVVYMDEHSDTDGLVLLAKAGIQISRYQLDDCTIVHNK